MNSCIWFSTDLASITSIYQKLKFAIKPEDTKYSTCTRNIVYQEVLTNAFEKTNQDQVRNY